MTALPAIKPAPVAFLRVRERELFDYFRAHAGRIISELPAEFLRAIIPGMLSNPATHDLVHRSGAQ